MRSERPWGVMWKVLDTGSFWVKVIRVEPFQETSLQYHRLRNELHIRLWGFKTGYVRLWRFWKYVPKRMPHRLLPGVYLELAWGRTFEFDVVRLYDRYGRCEQKVACP